MTKSIVGRGAHGMCVKSIVDCYNVSHTLSLPSIATNVHIVPPDNQSLHSYFEALTGPIVQTNRS